MNKLLVLSLATAMSFPAMANENIINGMDFGPLAQLVGTWETMEGAGVDVAPAKIGSEQGAGSLAVSPFFETMTFEAAADAENASDQYLVALYYKQEVFRKSDGSKFHDQRGYFIYDAKNQMVYNSFCVPRTTCVTAEGPAGKTMTLTAPARGIAEGAYMTEKASTTGFSMNIKIEENKLTYSQNTMLNIYGQSMSHADSSTLIKITK
ncbi:FABP family protein [Moritella sp. 24]|uniref:heme-binding beta-barrel domain-containing protein n=1 Tax=Moritella sp. 24 TaxID=2746230 RepID=UPI001BAC81D1|nr:heme-binding beta-barrel domain-containing protein [Moritella sp. 24]QUM75789.1 FABP family protein [Moritella sp. 24]